MAPLAFFVAILLSSYCIGAILTHPRKPGDLELILRSQAGDTEAFGQLVTKYRAKILTVLYGIVCDEQDAQDLAQEGFLKAWPSIH